MREEIKLLTRWGRDKMTTICISFRNIFFKRLKNHCNLFLRVQLIINQNWFRQWLGTEKTLSHYLSQWWSRPMVHIWVSLIDWVDYFTALGKYPYGEKRYCLSACMIPSPPCLKVGNSDPSGWVGARDGLTVFCKIPSDVITGRLVSLVWTMIKAKTQNRNALKNIFQQ